MDPLTSEEVLGRIRDGGVAFVFGVIPGNAGDALGKVYPAASFVETFVDGLGAPWSGVWHAVDIAASMVLSMDHAGRFSRGVPDAWTVADLSTLRIWPLHAGVAVCMLDLVRSADDHGLVEWAPRSLLRRQVAELARVGFALRCATETEFHLFARREEELARNNYHELEPVTPNLGLHIEGLLAAFDVIAELLRAFEQARLGAECAAAEFGPGQFEINLRHGDPLDMADRHLLYKLVVKQLARSRGLTASFMALPLFRANGNSSHVHASLWTTGGDPVDETMVDSFVAAQLELATDLQLLMAPYPNSYRRFRPPKLGPLKLVAGRDNRTAACRIIVGPEGRRVENRIPGADANPYLVLAAIAAMARHGATERLPQPRIHDGLVTTALNAPAVPDRYDTAITNLDNSERARKLLGTVAVSHLIALARHEATSTATFVTERPNEIPSWELARYLTRA